MSSSELAEVQGMLDMLHRKLLGIRYGFAELPWPFTREQVSMRVAVDSALDGVEKGKRSLRAIGVEVPEEV